MRIRTSLQSVYFSPGALLLRALTGALGLLCLLLLHGCGDVSGDAPSRGRELGTAVQAASGGSCVGLCGGNAGSCWCDSACTTYGDCCSNYQSVCAGGSNPPPPPTPTPTPTTGSCVGHCGGNGGGCWCDSACTGFGDCCSNYSSVCAGGSNPPPPPPSPSPPPSGPPSGWTAINPGVTVGGSIALNGQIRYAFPRVAGRTYRVVMIPGGDAPGVGDIDLYTGSDSSLSLTNWQCRPYATSTTPEVCTFTAAANGWNHVIIHGYAAGYYTLSVYEQGAGPAPAATAFDPAVNAPWGTGWYDAQPFLSNNHLGADLNREGGANADLGSVVYAVADGTVTYAANAGTGWNGVVILRHTAAPGASFSLPGGGTATTVWSLYGHVNANYVSSWLQQGDVVRRGQPIGVVGPTPSGSTGPHCHLELRTQDLGPGAGYASTASGRVNPIAFIAQN